MGAFRTAAANLARKDFVKKYGEDRISAFEQYTNRKFAKDSKGIGLGRDSFRKELDAFNRFNEEKGEVFKTYGAPQNTISSELGNDFNNTQKKRTSLFSNDNVGFFGN